MSIHLKIHFRSKVFFVVVTTLIVNFSLIYKNEVTKETLIVKEEIQVILKLT